MKRTYTRVINEYVYLTKENPLACTKDNPRFHLVLGFYISFIETMFYLVWEDFSDAKNTISVRIVDYMPIEDNCAMHYPYKEVLTGEYAEEFGKILDAIYEIWSDIQTESVPDDNPRLEVEQVIHDLKSVYEALLDLYKSTQSK